MSVFRMKPIQFFDQCRKWNNRRSRILDKVRLYGIYNLAWDLIANVYLRCYFDFTKYRYNLSRPDATRCSDLIISLTSYPKRIGYVWLTIESLLRQTTLPERVILYLSKEQFPKEYENIPTRLLNLMSRGLEINFVNGDLRSHKKYFYAMQEFYDKTIITVDDDCLYPEDMIQSLWETHREYPNAIVGNRAKRIYPMIPRYEHWPALDNKMKSYDLLFVGCAGILYPPHTLHSDVFDISLIRQLAFSADDIWLSCMGRLKKTPMVFTGYDYHHLRTLIPADTPLFDANAKGGGNQQTVDNLNNYYLKTMGKRPFVDMVGID